MSPRAGFPGWTVAFQRSPGDTLEAIAWLTATGGGTAVLRATWTARNHTDADGALVVAAGPGAVMVHLGPLALPDR